MAITPDFAPGLIRLHRALDGLLSVESRQLDELTPAEILLESQWRTELEPVLSDLYWWPLRNGLEQAPEDEDDLLEWLLLAFLVSGSTTALRSLLRRYQGRGANIGGATGLDLLGIGGGFNLTNRRYLDILDSHATTLTTAGTDLSLIDTTVNHLAQWIPAARASAQSTLLVLGRSIAAWSIVRSANIAVTELSRVFAQGLNWTYSRNGVEQQVFTTRLDGRVCPRCAPLHGRIMPVNAIPLELLVPIHGGCRCYYMAVTEGWERPANVWRGE